VIRGAFDDSLKGTSGRFAPQFGRWWSQGTLALPGAPGQHGEVDGSGTSRISPTGSETLDGHHLLQQVDGHLGPGETHSFEELVFEPAPRARPSAI
jgi:hypothetical protein